MMRWTWLPLLILLPACAQVQPGKPERSYAGTIQKVFQVTLQGQDLPGMRMLGQLRDVVGPALRRSTETHQYVVRTPTGQIIAQSDDEFAVGDCVEVVPQSDAAGPAFRYGQAQIVKSDKCTT